MSLGVGDEFRNGTGWKRWIDFQDRRHTHNACYRRDVANEVEPEFIVKGRVDGVRERDLKERIAIGRRFNDRLRGEIAGAARSIVDNELLAELLRQPLRDQTSGQIADSAGRITDNEAYWPHWIGLR